MRLPCDQRRRDIPSSIWIGGEMFKSKKSCLIINGESDCGIGWESPIHSLKTSVGRINGLNLPWRLDPEWLCGSCCRCGGGGGGGGVRVSPDLKGMKLGLQYGQRIDFF